MKIADQSIEQFLHNIATKPCTPAGGSIAALCAACAASLTEMVARHTINHKNQDPEIVKDMEETIEICSSYRKTFLEDMDRDTKAYKEVIHSTQRTATEREICHKNSVKIPLEIAQRLLRMLSIVEKAIEEGNENLITDGIAASLIAKTTLITLIYHMKFNLTYIQDSNFVNEIITELDKMESQINSH